MSLDDKVAVVTGGARGIGAVTVAALAAVGARVMIGDVESSAGRATAQELGCGFVHADVSKRLRWRG